MCACVWLVLRCGLSRRLYSFFLLAVDMCVHVHFLVTVYGMCVVCTAAAPAHHLRSRGPLAPWVVWHTHWIVCMYVCLRVSVCVCSGLATTQDPDCTLGRAPT